MDFFFRLKYLIYSLLVVIFLVVENQSFAQKDKLTQRLLQLWPQEQLRTGTFSFVLVDTQTGLELADYEASKTIIPASTLKLVTTATALELLGSNFRFETQLRHSGSIQNGVLKGDLILVGGGDPCLGVVRFGNHYTKPNFMVKLLGFVQKKGIKQIEGQVIGNSSLYGEHTTNRSWTWEDIGNYWGANPHALSIYENYYSIYFDSPAKADQATKITRISPEMNDLRFENRVRSSDLQADKAYIFGSQMTNQRWIEGTIPKNKKNYRIKGSIGNPPLLAAQTLRYKLNQSGITVKKLAISDFNTYPQAQWPLLGSIVSPTLADIVNQTNAWSINLYAEHLLRQIGLKQKNMATAEAGAAAEIAFWAKQGMDTKGLFIADGSGLSLFDGINARQIAFVLRYMATRSMHKTSYLASLPVLGRSGTLMHLGKNSAAAGRVRAKTGSMNRCLSFGGYIEAKSGRQLIFFTSVNNFSLSDTEIKNKIVELLSTIVTEN